MIISKTLMLPFGKPKLESKAGVRGRGHWGTALGWGDTLMGPSKIVITSNKVNFSMSKSKN